MKEVERMVAANPLTTTDQSDLEDRARRHLWLPFGRSSGYFDDPTTALIIDSAEGIYVTDVKGRRYIDASGAQGTASVGFGNQFVKDAMAAQLDRMAANPSTFPPHPPLINLAERIAKLAPAGLSKVFFAVSGTDANETAVKIVRQYFRITGKGSKRAFVVRWNGYHGSSWAMAAATGVTVRRRMAGPFPEGFIHMEPPYTYRPPFGLKESEWMTRSADELERLVLRHDPSNIAGFLGEPTMGPGGCITAPPGYWRRIRDICDASNLLLVFDEMITGFGRTGDWFAAQKLARTEGVIPDLITFGKGVAGGYYPVSGVIVSDRIAAAFDDSPDAYLHDGYTFGGTPLGAAAALATLDYLRDHNIVEQVAAKSERLVAGLTSLRDRSRIFGDLRSDGLVLALELVADKETRQPFADQQALRQTLVRACLKNGILAIVTGPNLSLMPPLTITLAEIDDLVDRIASVLADVERTMFKTASAGDEQ